MSERFESLTDKEKIPERDCYVDMLEEWDTKLSTSWEFLAKKLESCTNSESQNQAKAIRKQFKNLKEDLFWS